MSCLGVVVGLIWLGRRCLLSAVPLRASTSTLFYHSCGCTYQGRHFFSWNGCPHFWYLIVWWIRKAVFHTQRESFHLLAYYPKLPHCPGSKQEHGSPSRSPMLVAEVQGLGAPPAGHTGIFAVSFIGSRAGGTSTGTHRRCWWCRKKLYPLSHNNDLFFLLLLLFSL